MEVTWRVPPLPPSSTGFHLLPVDSATLAYSIPNIYRISRRMDPRQRSERSHRQQQVKARKLRTLRHAGQGSRSPNRQHGRPRISPNQEHHQGRSAHHHIQRRPLHPPLRQALLRRSTHRSRRPHRLQQAGLLHQHERPDDPRGNDLKTKPLATAIRRRTSKEADVSRDRPYHLVGRQGRDPLPPPRTSVDQVYGTTRQGPNPPGHQPERVR
jgi:hypothetical protein